jgi:hypothetical protein
MGKAFWCGRLLEGKRIAEGELLASMRAETFKKAKERTWTVRVCTENFIHRL